VNKKSNISVNAVSTQPTVVFKTQTYKTAAQHYTQTYRPLTMIIGYPYQTMLMVLISVQLLILTNRKFFNLWFSYPRHRFS